MVHTAFNLVSIVEKLPLRIECIEVWPSQSRLLVGTTEGVLFIYEIKEKDNTGRNPYFVSLVAAEKTFAKKPIMKIAVVEEPYNILISMSDGFISVHDLANFGLRFQMAKSKGCHMFVVERTKNSLHLCVAIKRKITLFTWEHGEFIETKEFPSLPDSVRSIVWCGENICLGFRREYTLLNIQTGAMGELFPTGKGGVPLGTLLPNEQILLGRDDISIFIGYDGKPTRRYGLTWSETPIALAYSFPYVLALLSKQVEVHTISDSRNFVQIIPVKTPKALAIHEGKTDLIYIAAQNHIWRLAPVPILNQIDQLVAERDYEEALQLCDHLNDPRALSTIIPASSNNNIANTNVSVKDSKVAQIKQLYSYHLFCQGQFDRAMEYFRDLHSDPLGVIGLFPNLLPKDLKAKYHSYPIEIPDLAGAALDKALSALAGYLSSIRGNFTASKTANNADEYSASCDVITVIDTCLLKAYIKTDERALTELVSKPNNIHIKEAERVLIQYKKEYELVLLYKSKGMHRNALELLHKINQGQKNNPMGVLHVVNYLKDLGREHIDLILEFSRWVLQNSPEEALTIFTADRSKENELPAAVCLAHIKPWASQLVVPFLEYLIHNRKETSADFHNELVFNYLDTVLALRRDYGNTNKTGTTVPAGSEPGLLGATRKKLLAFLDESQYYHPEKMFNRFPSDDLFEERAILLNKIGQHDKALYIYAHKLKNYKLAEEYCAKNYNSEKEDARDVYLSLLKVYLKPPVSTTGQTQPEFEPMVQPALTLLNKYYQRINIPRALELLPPTTSISNLYAVLEAVVCDNNTHRRNNQVVKNLLRSENLQIREQLIRARAQTVLIQEDRTCPVCSKRLGPGAFACYPNGTVVHYACCKDKQVCPVTKTNFKIQSNQ